MPRHRKLIRRVRAPGPRRRRAPETARQELLDAAERVFGELNPDQVGLVDIAREAGVSHALITHYFGTYDGLVEAALERRTRALRQVIMTRLGEAGALARPAELLGIVFRTLEDPIHLRLIKWLVAGERTQAPMFALADQGLQIIAHQVAEALRPRPPHEMIQTIEIALLTAMSAAFGYAISKYALAAALGRTVSHELDAAVQKTLAAMLQSHLRDTLGPLVTPGSFGS